MRPALVVVAVAAVALLVGQTAAQSSTPLGTTMTDVANAIAAAGGGPHVILLGTNTYTGCLAGGVDLSFNDITIRGDGPANTIIDCGNTDSRAFVAAGLTGLVVEDLTVSNVADSSGDSDVPDGACLRLSSGASATVSNVVCSDIYANDEPNATFTGALGGLGVKALDSMVTVTGSTFRNIGVHQPFPANHVTTGGTAIYADTSTVLIDDCSFINIYTSGAGENVNNIWTQGVGGSVYAGDSPMIIRDSYFTNSNANNRAGAVYAVATSINATVLEIESTEFDNTFCTDGYGGAIATVNVSLVLNNATISNSYAQRWGGAVYAYESSHVDVINSNLVANEIRGVYSDLKGGAIMLERVYTTRISGSSFRRNLAAEPNNQRDLRGAALGVSYDTPRNDGERLFIHNTTFEDNSCSYRGGAVAINFVPYRITASRFVSNTASAGAALLVENAKEEITAPDAYTIDSTTFERNFVTNGWSAEFLNSHHGTIALNTGVMFMSNSIVRDNVASDGNKTNSKFGAAGLFIDENSLNFAVVDSVFSNNTAYYAPAMLIHGRTGASDNRKLHNAVLRNVTFDSNTALAAGPAAGQDCAYFLPAFDPDLFVGVPCGDPNTGVETGTVFARKTSLLVEGCTFVNNVGVTGGGLSIGQLADGNTETVVVNATTFRGNTVTRAGGGFHCSAVLTRVGTLRLDNNTFEFNSAGDAGGGLILNEHCDVAVTDSLVFSGNYAGKQGGGMALFAPIAVSNSQLTDNSAGVTGGHISSWVDLVVDGSSLRGGTAGSGGAVSIRDGSARLVATVLSDNTASFAGGAVSASCLQGLDACAEALTVVNSTLTNNAGGTGGAISSVDYQVNLTDVRLVANIADGPDTGGGGLFFASEDAASGAQTLTVARTMFVGNSATSRGGGLLADVAVATLEATDFDSNWAGESGGGAMLDGVGSVAVLTGATFSSNFAGNGAEIGGGTEASTGGGLSMDRTHVTIDSGSVFDGNAAAFGGAIYQASLSLNLTTVAFVGNNATRGGAAYVCSQTCDGTTLPVLGAGVTYSGNRAVDYGPNLATEPHSLVLVGNFPKPLMAAGDYLAPTSGLTFRLDQVDPIRVSLLDAYGLKVVRDLPIAVGSTSPLVAFDGSQSSTMVGGEATFDDLRLSLLTEPSLDVNASLAVDVLFVYNPIPSVSTVVTVEVTGCGNGLGLVASTDNSTGVTTYGCRLCTPGEHSGDNSQVCALCSEGTASSAAGQAVCTVCPQGFVAPAAGLSLCTVCNPGTYTLETGSSVCDNCPETADCTNGVLTPKEDYYVFPKADYGAWFPPESAEEDLLLGKCPPGFCVFEGGNWSCAENHRPDTDLCGGCVDGAIIFQGQCTECTGVNVFVIFASLVFLLIFVIYILWFLQTDRGRFKSIVFFGQTIALILQDSVNLSQEANAFWKTFNFGFEFIPRTCAADVRFYGRFWLTISSPFMILAFLSIIYLIERFVVRQRCNGCGDGMKEGCCRSCFMCIKSRADTSKKRQRYRKAYIAVMLFTYTPTMEVVLDVMNCRSRFPGDPKRVLAKDPEYTCSDLRDPSNPDHDDTVFDPQYKPYRIIAIILLIVYVYAVPLIVGASTLVLKSFRDLRDKDVQARYGLLFVPFHYKYFYWEFVVQLRKTLVVSIFVFFSVEGKKTVLVVLFVSLLILHLVVQPMRHDNDNRLETLFLTILVGVEIMLMSTWLQEDVLPGPASSFFIFVIFPAVTVLICLLAPVIKWLIKDCIWDGQDSEVMSLYDDEVGAAARGADLPDFDNNDTLAPLPASPGPKATRRTNYTLSATLRDMQAGELDTSSVGDFGANPIFGSGVSDSEVDFDDDDDTHTVIDDGETGGIPMADLSGSVVSLGLPPLSDLPPPPVAFDPVSKP